MATGEELYKAVCKLWRKEGLVAFNETEKCLKQFCTSSGDYNSQAESFKKEYESTPEMQETIPDYMPYKNTLTSYKMPVTKITYEINGQEYVMYLLGDNGVICYDDLPHTVKAFDMSNAERRKYNSYALERHQELAKLTAYIFNLDGINLEESKSLSLILKHMCMDAYERDRYIRYLTYRYTPEIPAKKMLKKAKHLLMSKKLISYVWQCIAVDHEISPKEQEFFDKLVACYNLPESELSSLKRFSSKFATLADDQFVKEYLDSRPVYFAQERYMPWLIGMALGVIFFIVGLIINEGGWSIVLGLVLGISSFFLFRRNLPPEQKEIDKYYKELCKEPELDKMEANGSDFLLKIRARIGIFFDRLFGGYTDGNGTIDTFSDVDHTSSFRRSEMRMDDDDESERIPVEPIVAGSAIAEATSASEKKNQKQQNKIPNTPPTKSYNQPTTLPKPLNPSQQKSDASQLNPKEPAKKSNKTPIIIGIVAVFIVIGALVSFLLLRNHKTNESETQIMTEAPIEAIEENTNPCLTVLNQLYDNYVFGNQFDQFGQVVDDLFTKKGKQKLLDAYDYDCETGDCYGIWALRTMAQDGDGESKIIDISQIGNGKYTVKYLDMGTMGETMVTFAEENGKMKIDDFRTIFDESYDENVGYLSFDIAGLYSNKNENEFGCLFLYYDGSYMTVGYDWPEEKGHYVIQNNEVMFAPSAVTNIEDDPAKWIEVSDRAFYVLPIDNTNQKVGRYTKEAFLTEKEVAEAKAEYGDDWVFMVGGDGFCTRSTLEEFKQKSAFDDENTSTPSQSVSIGHSQNQVVVIDGSGLRLRLGPSTSSDTFKWPDGTNRHPNVGDKFKYLGESGDFYKIDFNGNELWVSKQFSHIE